MFNILFHNDNNILLFFFQFGLFLNFLDSVFFLLFFKSLLPQIGRS